MRALGACASDAELRLRNDLSIELPSLCLINGFIGHKLVHSPQGMPVTELAKIETAIPAEIEAGGALANLAQHAAAARGAYAGNTERALRADVTIFTAWCSDAGATALPAVAATVAAFIDAMAALKAPATVRRYVSSIATFHRAAGVANPCETQPVKLALKRMHRERGRAQAQAAPVNDVLVARMLAAAGDTLRHRRNRALLAVAYSTLCRRSELVALRCVDLQVDAEGFGTITIRRSKTDQEGLGDVAPIAADAMRHLAGMDPVRLASPTGRCSAPC